MPVGGMELPWMHRWMGKDFLLPLWKSLLLPLCAWGVLVSWELLELHLRSRVGESQSCSRKCHSLRQWMPRKSLKVWGLALFCTKVDLIVIHFLFPFCHLSWLLWTSLTSALKGTTPVCFSITQGNDAAWPGSPRKFSSTSLRNWRSA